MCLFFPTFSSEGLSFHRRFLNNSIRDLKDTFHLVYDTATHWRYLLERLRNAINISSFPCNTHTHAEQSMKTQLETSRSAGSEVKSKEENRKEKFYRRRKRIFEMSMFSWTKPCWASRLTFAWNWKFEVRLRARREQRRSKKKRTKSYDYFKLWSEIT